MSPSAPERMSEAKPKKASQHDAKGYIRGSSLFLVGRLISVGVNFLVGVLTVRYLTKSDYGAFAWAQTIATSGATLVLLGLNRGVARFAAMQHERQEYGTMFATILLALGTVVGLGLVVVQAAFGLSDLAFYFIHSDLAVGLLLILIALVPLDALDALFETLMAVFARVRAIFFRRYVLAPCLKLAAVLAVMAFRGDVRMLAAAYVVASLIGVAVYVRLLHRVLKNQGLLAHLSSWRMALPVRSLFSYSLPVMSTDMIVAFETTMVVVLLERMRSTIEVAETKAALQVAGLCLLVFQNSKILFKPVASRLYARGDDSGLGDLYWRSASWIAIVSFPIFAFSFFLAEPLIVLLFDNDYAGAGVLLSILAAGKYVNAAMGMNTYTLQVHARVGLIFLINLTTAIIGLGLCLWLIPLYGSVGAASAMSGVIVVRNLLNQAGLMVTTRAGIAPRGALRLYASILAAVGLLAALHMVTENLFVLVPALLAASALLPWLNRGYLDIAATFPELERLPLMRRFLGGGGARPAKEGPP
jgi:O-antigen/teichoic acid export membrane protein